MLGLAKWVGARFLLTSTSEVYGDPLEHPQSEIYCPGFVFAIPIFFFLLGFFFAEKQIFHCHKRTQPIEFRENTADDPHKRKPHISKAKEKLGWEPTITLRKGLPLMVNDFRTRIFGDHSKDGKAISV